MVKNIPVCTVLQKRHPSAFETVVLLRSINLWFTLQYITLHFSVMCYYDADFKSVIPNCFAVSHDRTANVSLRHWNISAWRAQASATAESHHCRSIQEDAAGCAGSRLQPLRVYLPSALPQPGDLGLGSAKHPFRSAHARSLQRSSDRILLAYHRLFFSEWNYQ